MLERMVGHGATVSAAHLGFRPERVSVFFLQIQLERVRCQFDKVHGSDLLHLKSDFLVGFLSRLRVRSCASVSRARLETGGSKFLQLLKRN